MYEFKKLSDVTLLESVPEGASVLAEVDGTICRVPGDGLGGNNSAGGYDVSYPEETFTYDGELEGREYIQGVLFGTPTYFVRIGDCVKDVERFYRQEAKLTTSEGPIIDETVTGFALNSIYNLYMAQGSTALGAVAPAIGKSHTVTWDGTEYTCTGQDASGALGEEGWVALGNCANNGMSGNDEPFAIVMKIGRFPQYAALTDEIAGGEHTVKVVGEGGQVITLDASLLVDFSDAADGLYPAGAFYIIGEGYGLDLTEDVDLGPMLSMLSGEEVPETMARSGVYSALMQHEDGTSWMSSLTAAAYEGVVELPEKYTEVKSNRIAGYWFDGVTLEWNGDTEGMETIPGAGNFLPVKLSDEPIPAELEIKVTLTKETTAEDGTVTTETEEHTVGTDAGWTVDWQNAPAWIAGNDYVLSTYEDCLHRGTSFKRGVWVGSTTTTNSDGTSERIYASKITVGSGWAKWPDFLSGYDQDEARDYIMLKSATSGSTKKFKVTVNDSGTLTATEITN